MNQAQDYIPKERKKQLITKEVDGELIVYDRETDRVHCLNSTTAFVFNHCDGQTSVATIARKLEKETKAPVDPEIILYALDLLNKSNLLDDSNPLIASKHLLSRRRAVMSLAVATALAVPVISSIMAPTAAQAGTCLPSGAVCSSDDACCSNSCVDSGRGTFECA